MNPCHDGPGGPAPACGGPVCRASAPVRLDFAGGWTDVSPFAAKEGGVVVNAAIELRARVEVRPGSDRYVLDSAELGERVVAEGPAPAPQDGRWGLLAAALRLSGLGPCSLTTRSDAPPGSGLGGSGALGVALVAALDAARGIERAPVELAEAAWRLETVEAGLAGGRQDQYAAALGGFHRLTFTGGTGAAQPLHLDPECAARLAAHLVVCYTGTSRVSSRAIARVMRRYEQGDAEVVDALRALVEVAERMAEALPAGDLARIGVLLSENWRHQQRLDPAMRTDDMARLERTMAAAGAWGGKAAGAGAGGSMFFVVRDRERALAAARECGARPLPAGWAARGVLLERAA